MAGFDLAHALMQLGVDEKTALGLKSRLDGGDYMNLVNMLNTDDLATGINQASAILGKYGVKLNGSAPMAENFDYLNSLFASYKDGKSIDESVGEWLQPITESSHADYRQLTHEGFNYFANLQDSMSGDKLIDWLDENQVEYLTDGKGHFHVKCGDRESTYKVGRAISEIMKKRTVRDSADREESVMSEKKASKREREAKEKIAAMKPRDPNVVAMNQRGGKGAHQSADPRKADAYDRKAKHKRNPLDEEIDFTVGEAVLVGENEATIQIPHGPNGTIGVMMDGQLSMVDIGDVARLNEGVIGMTPMKSLFRLRELAGLPPAPAAGPEVDAIAAPVVDAGDELEDVGIDIEPEADELGVPAAEPSEIEPEIDAVDDLSTSLEPASLASDPAGGMPGDLPPDGGDLAPLGGSQSDAMNQIEDNLNNIQRQLADIRLGEYKTVIRKLQDLTNQVQMMGRDYLGERRKK